jgi:hypothetical protein
MATPMMALTYAESNRFPHGSTASLTAAELRGAKVQIAAWVSA